MQELLPGSYIIVVEPSPATDGVTRPTNLVAIDMSVVTSTKVSDDVIYRVTKALHENKKDLVEVFPPFALFNPAAMSKAQIGIEFHPGAVKYYQEAKLWPAKQ